ncbi:anti-sigma factor family protein [Phycicoccus sonneratiae]|uniref:Zf-HC2 domain-containing protein n=1 Tax=Phycicoccus sonneratiae TaxID=2807628 RepID=A0ABS2CL08_9MICO|nr:zf-HC2 domain-containing protein [Phycicoccus sonneraticus]MBM6400582.1 zf-HC2 domain-containing protein [Phycicoccus sonneraticus]
MTDDEGTPNGPDHEALRVLIGPYVLGRLDPGDTATLEVHLDTCASCRADLAELTPVAGALADVRGRAPALAEPPADLLDRVGAAVEAEGRRARRPAAWRTAGVAAAAAAVAVAVTLTGVRLAEPPPGPFEPVPVAVAAPGVTASAGVVPHTWGVEVRLSARGFDAGDRYRVVVLGEDGRSYPAGEFVGTGSRPMVCNLNSSVLRADAGGFEVLDTAGTVLARSTFAPPRA